MTSAARDQYPLDRNQKDLIRYSFLAVGWLHWTFANSDQTARNYNGFEYKMIPIHPAFKYGMIATFAVLTSWTIFKVVRKIYLARQKAPPLRVQISYWSLILQLFNLSGEGVFKGWIVPGFHSLQYLLFVKRRLVARWQSQGRFSYWRLTGWFVAIGLLGYFVFNALPEWMTQQWKAWPQAGIITNVTVGTFVGIHHYFLDHMNWRRTDPEMQSGIIDPIPASVT